VMCQCGMRMKIMSYVFSCNECTHNDRVQITSQWGLRDYQTTVQIIIPMQILS
jgi:hypothetical protein